MSARRFKAVLVPLLALAGHQAAPAAAASIKLSLEGSPAVQVRGQCTIRTTSGEEQRIPLAGELPQLYEWEASGVDCELEVASNGTVEAILENGSNRSRARISGPGSRTRLRL